MKGMRDEAASVAVDSYATVRVSDSQKIVILSLSKAP